VAPPAVERAFRPGDRDSARATCGLRRDAAVVLVTGGSLAFGRLGRVVDAVLAAGDAVQAVVLCGRNARLRARLRARGLPESRLIVHGWTDQVPELVTAADVVLTTAGGMIATEALAAGRPVLFATPVPGHGRAGADMMAAAGLAQICRHPSDVTAAVRAFVARPTPLAVQAGFGGDLDAALRQLGGSRER